MNCWWWYRNAHLEQRLCVKGGVTLVSQVDIRLKKIKKVFTVLFN